MRLKIEDVLRALQGSLVHGDGGGEFTGVSTDSRMIQPGELFFAIKGQNFDGHNFVEEVAKKGASGAVVERGRVFHPPPPTPYFVSSGLMIPLRPLVTSLPSGGVDTLSPL